MKSIRTRLIRLVVLAILIPTALATSISYLYVRHVYQRVYMRIAR